MSTHSHNHAVERNHRESPLLKLPRELRNIILSYLLNDSVYVYGCGIYGFRNGCICQRDTKRQISQEEHRSSFIPPHFACRLIEDFCDCDDLGTRTLGRLGRNKVRNMWLWASTHGRDQDGSQLLCPTPASILAVSSQLRDEATELLPRCTLVCSTMRPLLTPPRIAPPRLWILQMRKFVVEVSLKHAIQCSTLGGYLYYRQETGFLLSIFQWFPRIEKITILVYQISWSHRWTTYSTLYDFLRWVHYKLQVGQHIGAAVTFKVKFSPRKSYDGRPVDGFSWNEQISAPENRRNFRDLTELRLADVFKRAKADHIMTEEEVERIETFEVSSP